MKTFVAQVSFETRYAATNARAHRTHVRTNSVPKSEITNIIVDIIVNLHEKSAAR